MDTTDKIFALIESWKEENIALSIELIRNKPDLTYAVEQRYKPLIEQGLEGSSLRILANLPAKWEKANTEQRAKIIEHYPPDATFFTDVIVLNASKRVDAWRYAHYSHQLQQLPQQLAYFKHIKELHLVHQPFEQLPEVIRSLPHLEVLQLEGNQLKSIPDWLTELTQLRVLVLKKNYGLAQVPDLGVCPMLEQLDFTYTNVATLSDAFFGLKHLRKITTASSALDHNIALLRRIKTEMPHVTLETLAEAALLIEEDKEENTYLGQENIKLDDFHLNFLPASLFAADVVKTLTIECYYLQELPDTFDRLTTLESLSIKLGNAVRSLPPSLCRLPRLRSLHLEGQLECLPDQIGDLSALETLSVSSYLIKRLPDSFIRLTALQSLTLEDMGVSNLAESLSPLSALRTLQLKEVGKEETPFDLDRSLQHLSHLEQVTIKSQTTLQQNAVLQLPPTLQRLTLESNWRGKGDMATCSLGRLLNHFTTLRQLDLNRLDLSDISEQITHPNHTLTEVMLYSSPMPQMLDSIGMLRALRSLSMLNCNLQSVAPSLYHCTHLEYLRISSIAFEEIPEGIEKLQSLIWLGMTSGSLQRLPAGVEQLSNLKRLVIGNTPLYKDKSFKDRIKRKIKGLKVEKEWY